MSRNSRLESPWWALRIGVGIGVKLRKNALEERQQSSKKWHNRQIRVGSAPHRYVPGHGARTSDSRRHRVLGRVNVGGSSSD